MSRIRDNVEIEGCCCNFIQCPYVSSSNNNTIRLLLPQCRRSYRNPYPISVNEIRYRQEILHPLIEMNECMFTKKN